MKKIRVTGGDVKKALNYDTFPTIVACSRVLGVDWFSLFVDRSGTISVGRLDEDGKKFTIKNFDQYLSYIDGWRSFLSGNENADDFAGFQFFLKKKEYRLDDDD